MYKKSDAVLQEEWPLNSGLAGIDGRQVSSINEFEQKCVRGILVKRNLEQTGKLCEIRSSRFSREKFIQMVGDKQARIMADVPEFWEEGRNNL